MIIASPVAESSTLSQITSGLTFIDWTIVVVLVISAIAAFFRGLIRSLFSVAGLIVGIFVASWYYAAVAAWLVRWVPQVGIAELIAFILIVVATIVLFSLAGRIIQGATSAIGLGFMDRLGGGAFGLFRGGLIVTAIIMPLAAFLPQSTIFENSVLAPYFLSAAHGVSFVVPNDFKYRVFEGVHRLQQGSQTWLTHTR